jgi:uncharacterized protein YegJ (DUF2314 family)
MPKLISHILLAVVLWLATGAFGAPLLVRLAAILVGAFIVHLTWEKFLGSPFEDLGAMPIADDDPLMLDAIERAKTRWPDFVAIYPEHRTDSMVKFRFLTDRGSTENLWGDLVELTPETATVYVRTPPIEHDGAIERTMPVPVSNIVDWQVEFTDGTLRGGYTNRALFKIFEREQGFMHPQFQAHVDRFRD